jgi:hypothetical protein|tara:strand:+ start:367 stop:792 length:426 start_codon:yes stop_codon:yes gene_type:complete
MHEVTNHELMIFVVLGFGAGLFSTILVSRLLEVVHTWKMVQQTVAHLLVMCLKIVEDVAFLSELKKKQMRDANFTSAQIREFQEVDEQTLTNWKDSVILSLVSRSPPHFQSMLPFKTWNEAMKFMNKALPGHSGRGTKETR